MLKLDHQKKYKITIDSILFLLTPPTLVSKEITVGFFIYEQTIKYTGLRLY